MIVPRNTVLQGHVLDKLQTLPNECADVVVTSTPYYGLRDYGPECIAVWDPKADCEHDWQPYNFSLHNGRGDAQKSGKFSEQENIPDLKLSNHTCSKCGAWKGQLGLEPHPSMFIDHLAQVFLEIKRCLKPSGSLWLNLGDTYFGGNGQYGRPEGWKDLENDKLSGHAPGEFIKERNRLRSNWLQPKQKMLIPARVAIALQDQGWILRNELVWHKVNHMPESCRDRLTRSWESVFFFVKSSRYYFDLDNIRKQPVTSNGHGSIRKIHKINKYGKSSTFNGGNEYNQAGANPGDVWTLTTEGLKEEHFAAFPEKLVKQILECSTPKEICNECNKARERVVLGNYERKHFNHVQSEKGVMGASHLWEPDPNRDERDRPVFGGTWRERVWSDCGCNKGFHSALILDPFAGAGTSLLVAHKMGFDWLGIELVPKYCEIIEKRIERHGKIRLDGFLSQTDTVSYVNNHATDTLSVT